VGATVVGVGVGVGVGVTETDGDGGTHGECDGRCDGVQVGVGAGGIGMPLAQTHITTSATWTRW